MKWFFTILCSTFMCVGYAQLDDFNSIDFTQADNVAKVYEGADLTNLPQLVYRLTNSLETDAERFRAIYYWVCHNVKNDYNLLLKNERKLKKYQYNPVALNQWKTAFKKEFFDKLLTKKKTICTGYAYLVKEMATLAGINCTVVHGFGKTNTIDFEDLKSPNHSWNAVELEGKWYLCDPTWSSGIIDASTYEFHFIFKEEYFLMAPEAFAERHRPQQKEWAFLAENETNIQTTTPKASSIVEPQQ